MDISAYRHRVLIHQWTSGKDTFRLIQLSQYTLGYRDAVIIESLGQDGMGDPRWIFERTIAVDDLLLDALVDVKNTVPVGTITASVSPVAPSPSGVRFKG